MKKLSTKTKTYAASIAATLAAGGLASILTKKNMNVYENAAKPPLSPPPAVFPIAWTALYVLMAVSFSRAILADGGNRKEQDRTLAIYAANIFMNFAWPIIFFNFKAFFPALIWLIGLFGVVTAMTVRFNKKDKAAAYMLIPYLVWLAFAGYLNAGMIYLNK